MAITEIKRLGLPIPDDYKPTFGELDNFVYLTLKYTVNWIMRQCDRDICIMMASGADAIVGDIGLSNLCHQACEYAWDHIAGEPDEFDSDKLFDHIRPILVRWYENSTPEDREQTN